MRSQIFLGDNSSLWHWLGRQTCDMRWWLGILLLLISLALGFKMELKFLSCLHLLQLSHRHFIICWMLRVHKAVCWPHWIWVSIIALSNLLSQIFTFCTWLGCLVGHFAEFFHLGVDPGIGQVLVRVANWPFDGLLLLRLWSYIHIRSSKWLAVRRVLLILNHDDTCRGKMLSCPALWSSDIVFFGIAFTITSNWDGLCEVRVLLGCAALTVHEWLVLQGVLQHSTFVSFVPCKLSIKWFLDWGFSTPLFCIWTDEVILILSHWRLSRVRAIRPAAFQRVVCVKIKGRSHYYRCSIRQRLLVLEMWSSTS